MADDLLGGIFGPQSDPLASVFGPQTHTAPNPQWTSNPLDKVPGHVDLSQPLRDAPQVHASSHDQDNVEQREYDGESWGEYAGDKVKSAAAGAASAVGMGVRGLGAGLERARDLVGKAVGHDQADNFLKFWLANPGSPIGALLSPTTSDTLRNVGQGVQDVSDAINAPTSRQNQAGNVIANATGQLAGLIGISAVAGPGAVDSAMLGQGFDQIDQQLKQSGEKGTTVSGDVATLIGGPVTAILEKTGLDAVLEGVPLPIKNRFLRGLADTMIVGGYEGAQEVAQQVVGNLATKLGIDPNTPVRDWPKGLMDGALPSLEGGAGAGFIARAILGRWGGHRPVSGQPHTGEEAPPGMRESGALSPDITPEDEASPLPTDLIVQGKMTVGAAQGTTQANQVLRASGVPDVGTRVAVTHNGRTQHGAVADAWTVNVAGQDSVGVKIKLDDGTMIEEPVATLRDMGVQITPVTLPSGLPEQDLANPVGAGVRRQGHGDRCGGSTPWEPRRKPRPMRPSASP
jgi:hypothetical protein